METSKTRYLSLAWQKESIAANKQLVAEWNKAHPKAQVDYVQGSWDNIHDQLVTSFEGGTAPDIIADAADDIVGARGSLCTARTTRTCRSYVRWILTSCT